MTTASTPSDSTGRNQHIPAHSVYAVALEEAGDAAIERAFRFLGGVLTSALGGRGDEVIGESVVIRSLDDQEAHLRIDVPDQSSAADIMELIRQDLQQLDAATFQKTWLHGDHEGRHVKKRD